MSYESTISRVHFTDGYYLNPQSVSHSPVSLKGEFIRWLERTVQELRLSDAEYQYLNPSICTLKLNFIHTNELASDPEIKRLQCQIGCLFNLLKSNSIIKLQLKEEALKELIFNITREGVNPDMTSKSVHQAIQKIVYIECKMLTGYSVKESDMRSCFFSEEGGVET